MSTPEKMPKGLEVSHKDGGLVLSFRQNRAAGFFLVLAGLFWLAMLPSCGKVIFRGGNFGLWEMMAFLPFLGAALGFGYVGLVQILNRTEIALDSDQLSVSHHPLGWFGALRLPLDSVLGFQVKRDERPRDIRHRVTLALVADLRDGTQRPVLRAIGNAKVAKRLHQEVTTYLREARGPESADTGEGSSRA